MFRLSDATRRQTVLGLFLLLCLVPTALLVVIGVWRSLPGRIAAEERRLALLLGQPVRIDDFQQLHPGATLYEGLEIRDPESDRLLLRCDRLRTRLDSVPQENAGTSTGQLQLFVGTLTVDASSREAFRPMAERLLQRRIHGAPASTVLAARRLVLHVRGDKLPMRKFGAWVTLQPETSKVELNLQMEGRAKPAYLCLLRNRKSDPPVDGFNIASREGPLPCSLLDAILPAFPDLGSDASFLGWIVGSDNPDGWQLQLQGSFQSISLKGLVAGRLPYELSGTARLDLEEEALIRGGRIAYLRGTLRAENGQVSRELIKSMARELQLETTFPTTGPLRLSPYSELAAKFQLDGAGLRLWGQCKSGPDGALLVGGYRQYLAGPSPNAPPVRPTKIVAALTSAPEEQLSLSRHAVDMLRRVPLLPPPASETIAKPRPTPPAVERY